MSDNTNKGAVFFVTLLPDDYHGEPMIYNYSGEGDFQIPDEDDVFGAWSAAGYNAWSYSEDNTSDNNDEELREKQFECFKEYGDSPMYYAVYMIVTDDENYFENSHNSFRELIEEIGYEFSQDMNMREIEPEVLCERAKKACPDISLIIPIEG